MLTVNVNVYLLSLNNVFVCAVASPAMGHWDTTFNNFIFSLPWSKSDSQLSKYYVVCEIS